MRDEPPYHAPDVQLMPGFGLHKNYKPTMSERHIASRRADKFIADMRASGELDLEERRSEKVRKIIDTPTSPPEPWWIASQRKR